MADATQVEPKKRKTSHFQRKILSDKAQKQLTYSSVLSILSAALWLIQAATIASLISDYVEGTGLSSHIMNLIIFTAAGLLRILLNHVTDNLSYKAADDTVASLRHTLLDKVSATSPHSPHKIPSAQFTSLFAEKLNALYPYLTAYRSAYGRSMVMPLIILGISFWYSWVAGIILLIAGPLIPVFMALVGYAAQDASEAQLKEVTSLNVLLLDRLRALQDIRLLGAQNRTIEAFGEKAHDLRHKTLKVLGIAFLSSTVLELFSALGVAMMAVYIGFSLLGEINFGAYQTPLTVYEGVFLLLLAPDFFQPLRDLATAWHDKATAQALMLELEDFTEAQTLPFVGQASQANKSQTKLPGTAFSNPLIELQDLSISFNGHHTIQYPDTLIVPGKSLAITGSSGSGKSTLLALLAGLIPPTTGNILINGFPLNATNANLWRSQVAWIPQFPQFQSGTLADNLSLGSTHEHMQQHLAEALQSIEAQHIIDRLPEGLNTVLGEDGTGLSGGEARRIMIARAICSGRPILMVDEPTADLDEETALLIQKALLNCTAQGFTVIVATHDDNLASTMNATLSLEKIYA